MCARVCVLPSLPLFCRNTADTVRLSAPAFGRDELQMCAARRQSGVVHVHMKNALTRPDFNFLPSAELCSSDGETSTCVSAGPAGCGMTACVLQQVCACLCVAPCRKQLTALFEEEEEG